MKLPIEDQSLKSKMEHHPYDDDDDDDVETAGDLTTNGSSLPDPAEIRQTQKEQQLLQEQQRDRSAFDGCGKMWAWIVLLLVCLIGLTIGLVLGLSPKKDEVKSNKVASSLEEGTDITFVPVTRDDVREAMKSWLLDHSISDALDFVSSNSPQNKALDFLAYHDHLQWNAPLQTAREDITDLGKDDGYYHFLTRYVMSVFHAAMAGETWHYDLLFQSKFDTCEWFDVFNNTDFEGQMGVLCDPNTSTIVGLSFVGNELKGSIPHELGALTTLQHLEFIGNEILGELPKSLRQLTNLKTAIFNSNSLRGSLPAWLGEWTDLEVLYLSDNQFEGSLDESFKNSMTNLRILGLDNNLLTGSTDPLWSLSSKLEYLFLENNAFHERFFPASITSFLPDLVQLDVSGNKMLNGPLPEDIFLLPRLEILDLHDNAFAAAIPGDVIMSGGPNNDRTSSVLRLVALHQNQLSSSIPSQLANLESLTHLDVSTNLLTGDIPSELGKLENLSYLYLGDNQYNQGPIPSFIYTATSLEEVSLKSSNRSGPILDLFANETLSKLVLLDLDDNLLTGSIPNSIADIDTLEFLLLNRNQLTGTVPESLGELNLRMLLLDKNRLTGDLNPVACGATTLSISTADCMDSGIKCACCTNCCASTAVAADENSEKGNELCHPYVASANMDPSWEQQYARITYVFTNQTDDLGFYYT